MLNQNLIVLQKRTEHLFQEKRRRSKRKKLLKSNVELRRHNNLLKLMEGCLLLKFPVKSSQAQFSGASCCSKQHPFHPEFATRNNKDGA